jgi:epoxyqueuosine reductase QueG
MKKTKAAERKRVVRVQVGARMEKTLVKVLKGLAEYLDISLGDLLEGMALHALEGKAPFSKRTLAHVGRFKTVYGLGLTARDSHRLVERRDEKR